MSDFIANPASGGRDGQDGSGGLVLLAVLGTAALIAVTTIVVLFGDGGFGADDRPTRGDGATAQGARRPVLLKVSFEGLGGGRVRIAPGVSCNQSCGQEFARGTRLTVTADAADGSTFEGWGDACAGTVRCSFVMDQARTLTATFEETTVDSECLDDPVCLAEDGGTAPPVFVPDCQDRRDNDDDGLVDRAQDPGCDDGTEADGDEPPPDTSTTATTPAAPAPAPTTTPAPAPAAPANECADGQDNDDDGLVDTEQDPGCADNRTEAG